ncbi:ALKBH5 [Dendrobium catenatum]|uniref:ALKBH5 n=1 Tax=Dendrobium catenatum TaxID=906689 RepID=A0A2I0XJL1_9ASPA|nr:ALKBH5 [Dendrobium catenatum]
MDLDRFLQRFSASDLMIAEEFLSTWLPFLTKDLCEGCADILRGRIRSLNTGSHQNAGMSWADIAQQDEIEKKGMKNMDGLVEEEKVEVNPTKTLLSREDRERIRFKGVKRKKDFVCLERIGGKIVNILKGLELHTGVFSSAEQKRIVDFVYDLQKKGRNNELGEYTYSEPRKWMRGKGRVTIQFGCCYNYAVGKNGVPPGILRNVIADPIPNLFKIMIKRLVGWHVLPTYCVPDSCIVNIYEPGDCIPPHIDNHDFGRPFCTVSFLSECNIVFGSNLKIAGPGEFIGSASISLPIGSVLVLNGNGADIAKHCVPAVPCKRISITFRKMVRAKWPHMFKPEPDLQNIKPFDLSKGIDSQQEKKEWIQTTRRKSSGRFNRAKNKPLHLDEAEEALEQSFRHGLINDGGSHSWVIRHPMQ